MLCVASDRKMGSQVNGGAHHGFHCLVYKMVVEVSHGIPKGIYVARLSLHSESFSDMKQALHGGKEAELKQLNTARAHTHTLNHTDSDSTREPQRILSTKRPHNLETAWWSKLGKPCLQGQCPHVDSQASALWPKQLHPLIHLHETCPTWVCWLRETQGLLFKHFPLSSTWNPSLKWYCVHDLLIQSMFQRGIA